MSVKHVSLPITFYVQKKFKPNLLRKLEKYSANGTVKIHKKVPIYVELWIKPISSE